MLINSYDMVLAISIAVRLLRGSYRIEYRDEQQHIDGTCKNHGSD